MQSGFNQSRGLLLNAVQLISESVKDIQKMDEQSPRLQLTLGEMIAQIQASITALPDDHFDELENRLAKSLRVA